LTRRHRIGHRLRHEGPLLVAAPAEREAWSRRWWTEAENQCFTSPECAQSSERSRRLQPSGRRFRLNRLMARIKTLAPLVPRSDGRTVAVEPKRADPHYQTEAHRQWREQVLRKAGYQCEWTDNGERCTKAAPQHRIFADHAKERRDGGDPFDPANGKCLCGTHHSLKTARARARRMGLSAEG
jgi:5-methylcytosine-specific restriction enzyme A